MNNPNTSKPWVVDEDYCWEDPNRTFHGLRNPRADHNRILFFPEHGVGGGVLVCWVNTQKHSGVSKYVNNKRYMDHDEARHLWGCLIHPDRMYIPDNSVPPRMVQPKHPDSGWGKVPEYSVKMKEITNYALEA